MKEGAKVAVIGPAGSTVISAATNGRFWSTEVMLPNNGAASKQAFDLYFGKTDASGAGTIEKRTAADHPGLAIFMPPDPETPEYDADGNLVKDGQWSYTYDALNQLVEMETVTPAVRDTLRAIPYGAQPQKLMFAYDYLGRRVSKTVCTWSPGIGSDGVWLPDNAASRRYLYQGWNLVAEYDLTSTSNLNLLATYHWGLDIAGTLTQTAGVGALLMIRNHTTDSQTGNKTYLAAYDGNGNLTGLVDNNKTTAAVYEYSPFGELMRSEGYYAQANPYKFSTRYHDIETGLVYYGQRYYDPKTGRFINRDPIEEAGGMNLYAFVGNNPIQNVDVLGQDGDWAFEKTKCYAQSDGTFICVDDDVVDMGTFTVTAHRSTAQWIASQYSVLLLTATVSGVGGGGVDGRPLESIINDMKKNLDKIQKCSDLAKEFSRITNIYNILDKDAAELTGKSPNPFLNPSNIAPAGLLTGNAAFAIGDLAAYPDRINSFSIDNIDFTKVTLDESTLTLAGKIGVSVTGITAAYDSYNAINSFFNGNYTQGIKSSLMAGIGAATIRAALLAGVRTPVNKALPWAGIAVAVADLLSNIAGQMYVNNIINNIRQNDLDATVAVMRQALDKRDNLKAEMLKNGCN